MFLLLNVLVFFSLCTSIAGDIKVSERHSFSLTTFDSDGKLVQVERAVRAAHLGVPVLACISGDGKIHMIAPQVLPSPLISDDGTPRFSKVSPNLIVAHTGLDGRLVVFAAERLAIEHELTFDEEIRTDSFLEEMSLLFQNYTMRPGYRPFGCTLLVGSLETKELYRIDPSGSVETLGTSGAVGSLSNTLTQDPFDVSTMEGLQATLETMLEETKRKKTKTSEPTPAIRLILATLDESGLSIKRQQMEGM